MTIIPIGQTGVAAPPRAPKQEMDGELFMTLLVTQLRHQDPSSPMDTNTMITQTTQLATMEKLQLMADTSAESFALQMRATAAALIGGEVSWIGDGGAVETGIATSVSFAGPVPGVVVGDRTIPLDAITGIRTPGAVSP